MPETSTGPGNPTADNMFAREDVEKQSVDHAGDDSTQTASYRSHHDVPPTAAPPLDQYAAAGDEIYEKYTTTRKVTITAVMSVCSLLAPLASTTVLSAIPEVAAELNTTGPIIGVSNALYMLFMGICTTTWGPLSTVYGRRNPCLAGGLLFFAFSIGTALCPNLASFFVFRILTAYQGTCFLIIGASIIQDIWKPTQRATAMGWFYSGTLIGSGFGPFVGGVIVTFRSWRDIFWLQTAMAGAAFLAIFFVVPETTHYKFQNELAGMSPQQKARKIWAWTNPWRFLSLFRYPPFITVGLASSSLVWNMYSLLTPIRYVISPRFDLSSPIESGLFYIAPGCGYLIGTFFGGPWADRIVKRWIRRRNGERVPEDRLRSCTIALVIVIPACMLIYGWSLEKEKGGIPLPVVVMFAQGVAQLFCYPSLNTYCVEVLRTRSSEVIGGNYLVRYFFAALGTAICLPAIQHIGIGWFSTISALFVSLSGVLLVVTTWYGQGWREAVEEKKAAKKAKIEGGQCRGE